MLKEIREQPAVLEEVGRAVSAFLEGRAAALESFTTILLLGCGDMDFSARTAAWLSEPKNAHVKALRSMDMRWYASRLIGGELVIAGSFSGRTPRTIEAAGLAKKEGAEVWGITGNGDTEFSRVIDRALVLPTGPREELTRHSYAGYHHNVPQTKTFTAVLMAELMLLDAAGRLPKAGSMELERLPADLGRFLPELEEGVSRFMEQGFRPVKRVALLGSGPWRALAGYGAAKFVEMAIPGRYQCMEENNHLEMFLADEDDFLVLLANDPPSWSRARELLEPYGRFKALRLLLAPPSVTGRRDLLHRDESGAFILAMPESETVIGAFLAAAALQLLAASLGPALGRDIDQWVGGERLALIEELGQQCVRESKIELDPA